MIKENEGRIAEERKATKKATGRRSLPRTGSDGQLVDKI